MGAVVSVGLGIVAMLGLFKSKPIQPNPVMQAIDEELEARVGAAEEARKAAEAAQEKAEADWRAATDAAAAEAEKAREAEKQSAQAEADKQKAVDAAAAEAEKAREAERRAAKVEAERERTEEKARELEKNAAEAMAARDKARQDLIAGVQPVEWPTREEYERIKKARRYTEGLFHFAIAGVSGSGKSSLINALRGLRSKDAGAAAVGIVETTQEVTRYPDRNPNHPFVWYDIPGAGTLNHHDWQYFNKQGLYIFDCITVLFDNRFTMIDIAILRNCARWKIPSYIVRSKSDHHIENVMKSLPNYDSDDEDGGDAATRRELLFEQAHSQFVTQTNESVQRNLKDADLPPQKVYFVSRDGLLAMFSSKVKRRRQNLILDEGELLKDILTEAQARRIKHNPWEK
jgi:chemotaxis protein histidine kinase CheA